MGLLSKPVLLRLLFVSSPAVSSLDSVSESLAAEKGCLSCHERIEKFSACPMMLTIKSLGQSHGDPADCVVCHGGTPGATSKDAAHAGVPAALAGANGPEMFYPDPGSV